MSCRGSDAGCVVSSVCCWVLCRLCLLSELKPSGGIARGVGLHAGCEKDHLIRTHAQVVASDAGALVVERLSCVRGCVAVLPVGGLWRPRGAFCVGVCCVRVCVWSELSGALWFFALWARPRGGR